MPPNANPLAVDSRFQTLGRKVFWFNTLSRSAPLILCFLVLIILYALTGRLIFASVSSYSVTTASEVINAINILVAILLSVTVFVTIAAFFISWIEFTHYQYAFDPHAFMTRKGIFNIEEYSIPYNKIQNVEVEEPLLYRMIGLARVVITSAGKEDTENPEAAEDGIIECIDKSKALFIQEELLKHSDVLEVVNVGTASEPAQKTQ